MPPETSQPASFSEPQPSKKHSLWHTAMIIMLIVFGPALLAWAVTLIRVPH